MRKIQFLLFLLLAGLVVNAQNVNPGENEIYRVSEIAVIRLQMDPADKDFLFHEDNIWSDVYLPAQFQFTNSLMDTALVEDVGIRLRGNTSRQHPKKSLKIKFKEYAGEKFYDLKKFNLKAEVNDPSMIREHLTLQTFRDYNVPAARTHHTEVYINGEYMGLYLNVEQIDDEFVQARYVYDRGNIYKCTWPATLENDNQIYNNDSYELKTNVDINDRSVLANFVTVLNNTPADQFEEAIEEVFNVWSYLRYLAVEALTGHWDGYSYNKNNFYLYENDSSGLVEFIPYDVDNTFGIDWVNRDWGTRDVLDWTKHGDPRPLTTKLLARSRYFNQFERNLDFLLKGDFSESNFFPEFDGYKSLLNDAVSRDVYYPLPFGYTMDDYANSHTQEVIPHAPYGLKPYITTRATLAREQIGIITGIAAEIEKRFDVYPNPSNGKSLMIYSEKAVVAVEIKDMLGKNKGFTIKPAGSSRYLIEFNLTSGLYILNVQGYSARFIVK